MNTYPSSGLFLGNSITVRHLDSLWWGYWGMAASTKQKDYVHVFESMAKNLNPNFTAKIETIRTWEADPVNFDLNTYSPMFDSQPDFVVVRIGENVRVSETLQAATEKLLDFIKLKAPKSKVYLTGNYWRSDLREAALKAAATSKAVTFIPLVHLDTEQNKSAIGAIVMGDDGKEHVIANATVAKHPGDLGHKAIAETLFAEIFKK